MYPIEHRYRMLMKSLITESDFDADGNVTDEAIRRIHQQALAQLTDADRDELEQCWKLERAEQIFQRHVDAGDIILLDDDTFVVREQMDNALERIEKS